MERLWQRSPWFPDRLLFTIITDPEVHFQRRRAAFYTYDGSIIFSFFALYLWLRLIPLLILF